MTNTTLHFSKVMEGNTDNVVTDNIEDDMDQWMTLHLEEDSDGRYSPAFNELHASILHRDVVDVVCSACRSLHLDVEVMSLSIELLIRFYSAYISKIVMKLIRDVKPLNVEQHFELNYRQPIEKQASLYVIAAISVAVKLMLGQPEISSLYRKVPSASESATKETAHHTLRSLLTSFNQTPATSMYCELTLLHYIEWNIKANTTLYSITMHLTDALFPATDISYSKVTRSTIEDTYHWVIPLAMTSSAFLQSGCKVSLASAIICAVFHMIRPRDSDIMVKAVSNITGGTVGDISKRASSLIVYFMHQKQEYLTC